MSSQPNDGTLDRSLALVRFLRKNCSWDALQTPGSLVPYLLEEAHEVADAIERIGDRGAGIEEQLSRELGDLLLNVAFQIVLAEERAAFTAADVVTGLEEKMQRRHPHLYGGVQEDWEVLKARERGSARESVLQGVAKGLDPLSKAQRIQERVSSVGFDWADFEGAYEKVVEEVAEVREELNAGRSAALEDELGDLLFAVVNLSRLSGVHAGSALRRANQKFSARFETLEVMARSRGVVLGEASLAELDLLWDEVKRVEG